MKQKLYLSIAAFLMLSFYAMSQSASFKEAKPYFGQKGITKKISELLLVKPVVRKQPDAANFSRLKSRLEKFDNFIKPEKKSAIANVNELQSEEDTKVASRPTSSVSSTSTQQVWSNFLGADYYENLVVGFAPNGQGDVGPSQVMVVSNLNIKVFDKPAVSDVPLVTATGYSRDIARSAFNITLDQFFSPVLPAGSYTDYPDIRYDRLSKRWFVSALEVNPVKFENNLILIAVSNGDKVTDSSSFTYYSFNSKLLSYNTLQNPYFLFPTLGVDKNAVLIGGRQYLSDRITMGGFVICKEKLIKGDLVVYPFELGKIVYANSFITGPLAPQAVYNDDPNAKKSFFIGLNGTFDSLIIKNIEYDKRKTPFLKSESAMQVPKWNFRIIMSTPGGLAGISTIPSYFLLDAAIHKNKLTGNSSLWTAQTTGISHNGNVISASDDELVKEIRNGSRWYKIGNIYTKPGLLQMGTVYDSKEPSGPRAVQYFNPSVAASGQGHSVISGTTCAYNQYLNVFAAGRYFGDELGKTKTPVKVTNSTAIYAPYYLDEDGSKNYVGSWGNYSQTVVDPLDDQTIWTFQEYANVDNSYGIRAVQFKAPPPASPASVGTLSNKTDTTIILEGTSVDNSGFFDPGKDVNGPGYNRLSVKSTGNIIVNNIKFISPTKISFKLNTANKPAGQYLVIIINPDGQLVVTDYTIAANTAKVARNNSSPARDRDEIAKAFITGSAVFPNPTTANTTLQINAAQSYAARIALINVDGKKVFERNYSFSKGSNQAILPTEKFTKGIYIAAVYNADNVLIATKKIVKQ